MNDLKMQEKSLYRKAGSYIIRNARRDFSEKVVGAKKTHRDSDSALILGNCEPDWALV